MRKNQIAAFLWLTTFCLSMVACRPQREVIYFQKGETTDTKTTSDTSIFKYEPVIRPNDILNIYVSSINREASSFFNPIEKSETTSSSSEILGYLVNSKGEIDMPLIGTISVEGLTVSMIRDTIKTKLNKYLENPTVRVILDNFNVTILGEVNKPGIYTVKNERMTVTDIIGMAGDLTIYGNRQNLLLIREENGKKSFFTINVSDRSIFSSTNYFLHPNDVIYVEPVKAKGASSDFFYRIFPIVVSSLTLISILFVRFK